MAGSGFWRDVIRVTEGDPTQYRSIGGAVIVPSVHELAERAHTQEDFGVPTENTNYGEIGKTPDYTTAINKLKDKKLDMQDALEVLQEAKKSSGSTGDVASENPQQPRTGASSSPRRTRRKESTKSETVFEELGKKSVVIWHTDYGDFSSTYDQVLVGNKCLILVFGQDAANVFMPKEASKETPFMYNIEFDGAHYRGMYIGYKASADGKTYLVIPVSPGK